MEDLDLLAASLRADADDLHAFTGALAVRFEQAFPRRTTVRRERAGMFGPKEVREVAVDLDGDRFSVRSVKGSVEATCARLSGGIVLKTERLDLADWIDALSRALAREAERSADAQSALQRLLTG